MKSSEFHKLKTRDELKPVADQRDRGRGLKLRARCQRGPA